MSRSARAILLVLLACAAPCLAQKKLALVIGIAGYPGFPEGEKLKYAGKDAEAFAAFIESEQGGKFSQENVHLVTNAEAKRVRLYKEFTWLFQNAGPEDQVYVFFAGHGVEYQNVLYFLPYDASKDNPDDNGIPMGEFFRKVTRNLAAKQVVVFIDACHAAGAAEGGRDRAAVDVQKEWDALNNKEGQFSMALFSSLANQRSWEDAGLGGGHGLFTWYLLEGLKGGAPGNEKGLITADALWNYVREKVEDRSRKRFPELQTPVASPSFRTDFLMARTLGKATTQIPDSPASTEATPAGKVRHNAKDEQNYVWIPAGSFMMGCSPGDGECFEDEKPAHAVTIRNGFWLGQTAMTVEAWKRYRLATGSAELPREDKYGRKINEAAGTKNLPAVGMTWDEAGAFCQWAGGRLPSEAEWEYAARAGRTESRYGELDDIAWYADNAGNARIDSTAIGNADSNADSYNKKLFENGNGPHPVARKLPNAWRLYDMLGNVWQWTADWYGEKYYTIKDGTDPQGPTTGTERTVRGGSWIEIPGGVRVSYRFRYAPGIRNSGLGARCVGETFP